MESDKTPEHLNTGFHIFHNMVKVQKIMKKIKGGKDDGISKK